MKRGLAFVLSALMLFPGHCYAEERIVINDGGMCIDGSFKSSGKNAVVNLTVTESEFDWLDKNEFMNGSGSDIIYFEACELDNDYNYKFLFELPESGEYNTYISVADGEEVARGKIKYINKGLFDEAAGELIASLENDNSEMSESILESRAQDLGLYGQLFVEYDYKTVVPIIKKSLDEIGADDVLKLIEKIEKSVIADCFNKDSVDDFSNISEKIYDRDNKYYNEKFDSSIIDYLSGKDIETVGQLEKLADEALILAVVNENDGVGTIKSVLTDYKKTIGLSSTKITTALCSAIAKKGKFSDIKSLTAFIAENAETDNNNGGGGSSGGGGSGSGGKGNVLQGGFSGTTSITTPVPEAKEIPFFDDIASVPWAREAIDELYKAGIVNGREERRFYPDSTLLREEFVKLLTMGLEINLVDSVSFPFADVKTGDWSYNYIKSAYLAGITQGVSADCFGAGMNITRQDLCVMVCNALDAIEKDINGNVKTEFKDGESIADYAKEAVGRLAAAGIVSGDENGNFNPCGNATRAEAAKIIYGVMKLI